MSTVPPTVRPAIPPDGPGEPSNRWPWIALGLGVLVIVVAVAVFFLNRQGNSTTINLQGTPSPVARASTASPGAPPTLVPPTLAPSANLAPTATPVPAPTQPPKPTAPPPTPPPAPTPTVAQAAPAAQPGAGTPAAAPANATPAATPAAPSPTVPAQIASPGGAGNPRSDFDATYGAPVGETSDHFVVYRKNNFEYHVEFLPDPNGRAAIIAEMPQAQAQVTASPQALTLPQAQAEAHKLLPKDAQPPNPAPEGNDQFVVERYNSQLLAQALPPSAFGSGQPGDFLIVYPKSAQGAITRWVLGPGDDPNALINQGR